MTILSKKSRTRDPFMSLSGPRTGLIALCGALALLSCGDDDSPTDDPDPTDTNADCPEEGQIRVNDICGVIGSCDGPAGQIELFGECYDTAGCESGLVRRIDGDSTCTSPPQCPGRDVLDDMGVCRTQCGPGLSGFEPDCTCDNGGDPENDCALACTPPQVQVGPGCFYPGELLFEATTNCNLDGFVQEAENEPSQRFPTAELPLDFRVNEGIQSAVPETTVGDTILTFASRRGCLPIARYVLELDEADDTVDLLTIPAMGLTPVESAQACVPEAPQEPADYCLLPERENEYTLLASFLETGSLAPDSPEIITFFFDTLDQAANEDVVAARAQVDDDDTNDNLPTPSLELLEWLVQTLGVDPNVTIQRNIDGNPDINAEGTEVPQDVPALMFALGYRLGGEESLALPGWSDFTPQVGVPAVETLRVLASSSTPLNTDFELNQTFNVVTPIDLGGGFVCIAPLPEPQGCALYVGTNESLGVTVPFSYIWNGSGFDAQGSLLTQDGQVIQSFSGRSFINVDTTPSGEPVGRLVDPFLGSAFCYFAPGTLRETEATCSARRTAFAELLGLE